MSSVTVLDSPPRPASGDGDVLLDVGQTRVKFSWKGGDLVDVTTGLNDMFVANEKTMKPDPTTAGVVVCRKCAKDTTTGQEVCWDVPC